MRAKKAYNAQLTHLDLACEHQLRWPRHNDFVVRLSPVDLQRPSRQLHHALAVDPANPGVPVSAGAIGVGAGVGVAPGA